MFAVLVALAAQPPAPKEKPDPFPGVPAFARDAVKQDPADPPLRKLQKERVVLRASLAAAEEERLRAGRGSVVEVFRARAALAEYLAELFDDPAGKVKCLEWRVAAARDLEDQLRRLVDAAALADRDRAEATLLRLDAEIDLLKFKAAAKPR